MPQSNFSKHFKEIHRLATSSYGNRHLLLDDYLHTGKKIFEMSTGIISQIDHGQYTILAASDAHGKVNSGDVYSLTDTLCEEVYAKKSTVMLSHVGSKSKKYKRLMYSSMNIQSYISAPLFVDGVIFGTLNFFSQSIRTPKFQKQDREIIEIMADDLGKVISLFKKDEQQNESDQFIKLLSEAVEASNDGIAISDPNKPDNPLIYVNKAFEKITGYSISDVLGKNCRFLQGGERDQPGVQKLRTAIRNGNSCNTRLKNFKKNGEVFWNDFRLSPIFDDNNVLKYFVGVQTDVTAEVNKEKLLTTVSNQRKELMRVAEEILAAQTEENVVQIIVNRLFNILLFDTAAIYVVDEVDKMLRPIAVLGSNWTSPDLEEWKIPAGTGIIGSIIGSQNGELINNSHLDPRTVYPKGAVIKKEHLIVQPLRSGESVWGAFIINRMSDHEFSLEEYEIVQFLTSYASLALENIQLVKKIKESEQSQRTILETISDGVISIDHHGIIFFMNEGIEKIFGYSSGELIGTSLEALVPLALRSQHRHGLERYTKTGKKNLPYWHAVSLPGLHKSGHEVPLEISFGESNKDGKRIFTGIIRDITERKRAEDKLNATTTRLSSLIQTIQAGVLVEDETRHISLINAMFCSMFSIPVEPNHLIGTDCSNSAEQSKLLFKDPGRFITRITELLSNKVVITNEELGLVDGRTFERDYIPIMVNEVYKGHMWLYRDITARKQNELEVEKLARFPNENPNPILRITKEFQILYSNIPGKRMLTEVGETRQDMIPSGWQPIIESTLMNRKTTEFEIAANQGTPIYLTHFVPIFPDGYVNMYARDITERKVAEWEANKAKRIAEESMRAKQDFLSKMSHELRTPMNAVLGLTNLMLNTPLSDEQASMIHGIKSSGSNLLVIINDILDLAKIEAGKLTIDQTDFVLKNTLENIRFAMLPLTSQKKIDLLFDIDPEMPEVIIGDPVRIGQILINLLSNAIKFTDHGRVVLSCRTVTSTERQQLLFAVHDTGIGIPDQKLQSIFESFSQASHEISVRYGGTGLGLTIVQQLVALMGGDVSVESTIGKGSTFSVVIPLKVSTQKKESLEHSKVPVTFKKLKGKVLLVEDNPANQLVALKTLQMWHVDVDVASDGYQALSALKKSVYDLVLMDIQMPGIDGFETTKLIRSELSEPQRSVPIYAMTASVLNDPEARAVNAGMNGYISKPFELDDLYKKISAYLKINDSSTEDIPLVTVDHTLSGFKHLNISFLESIAPNNPQFIIDMVQLFENNTPEYIRSIKKALQDNDLVALSKIAHTMKPTGAYIGVEALKPIVGSIEECADRGAEKTEIILLVQKLEVLCEEIFTDILQWKRSQR